MSSVDIKQFGSTTASALQASLSVILILGYGYYMRKKEFIDQKTENGVSKLCVQFFLPALLFTQIGPLATPKNLGSYWIIVVMSLLYQIISWMFALVGTKLFGFPQWLVPCMIFNNATSLPLLLLQSLGKTGTLKSLVGEGEEMDDVISRGRVYLLINALVCNLVRFTFGPSMMESNDSEGKGTRSLNPLAYLDGTITDLPSVLPSLPEFTDHTHGPSNPQPNYPNLNVYPNVGDGETSPLLNKTKAKAVGKGVWGKLRWLAGKLNGFMNPPMWGGLLAIVSGMIPFLRTALFNNKGLLSPFEQSVDNLGQLYTALQTLILGAQLYSKAGKRPSVTPLLYLFFYRFIVVTAISAGLVFGARKVLGDAMHKDPILDFMLILAPIGPSALSLASIVTMSDASEETTSIVAQTILVSHALTPLISLSVSAGLAVVQVLYPKSS